MATYYGASAGDSFYSIARKLFGDAGSADALMAANPGIQTVRGGQQLRVPDAPAYPAGYNPMQEAKDRATWQTIPNALGGYDTLKRPFSPKYQYTYDQLSGNNSAAGMTPGERNLRQNFQTLQSQPPYSAPAYSGMLPDTKANQNAAPAWKAQWQAAPNGQQYLYNQNGWNNQNGLSQWADQQRQESKALAVVRAARNPNAANINPPNFIAADEVPAVARYWRANFIGSKGPDSPYAQNMDKAWVENTGGKYEDMMKQAQQSMGKYDMENNPYLLAEMGYKMDAQGNWWRTTPEPGGGGGNYYGYGGRGRGGGGGYGGGGWSGYGYGSQGKTYAGQSLFDNASLGLITWRI